MIQLRRNRALVLLLATVVAVGLAVGAFAYWAGTGRGGASTVLGSPQQLTLSAGTPQAELIPGAGASVAVVATNANPYFVTIGSLALDTATATNGFEVDAGHSGCNLSSLHFVPQPAPVGIFGPGWRVPPKVASTNGTLVIDLAHALTMDVGAANACQGAAFTVHLVAGA